MASSPDSQNLSEAIASLATNMETLSKQINKQKDINACTYSETVYTDIQPEVTDDESTHHQYTARMTHEPVKVDYKKTREEPKSRITSHTEQIMKPAEALRTVETLNGINDTGVEEFIKSVRFARTRVSDTASLLHMILTEKVTDRAKQSIRFCQITLYEELYETLRTEVSIPTTVSGSKNKMQNTKQGTNETVESYSNRLSKL